MPFDRPTLSELRSQVSADIAAAIPGADALLRYSNMGILGDVQAALAAGHYGYLDWIAQQAVPFTATGEYLEGWAALKGVTRKPGIAAIGSAIFSGSDGTVLPSGSVIVRNDGVGFHTTADGTVAAGTVAVPILCDVAGAIGNSAGGLAMTLASGVVGIAATGTAVGAVTGGADMETDDSLRSRMLAAYSAPPQGGAATDYVEWALAVPGVTRCWVKAGGMGPGTVIVYFMLDLSEAGHNGFPQGTNGVATAETRGAAATGDQLILANAIFPLQPVTTIVYAVAPQPNTLNVTIAGIASASSAVKAQVSAAIRAALASVTGPGGVTNISAIESGIAAVPGTAGFVILLISASAGTVSPGITGNIVSNPGHLPVLGTVTFL